MKEAPEGYTDLTWAAHIGEVNTVTNILQTAHVLFNFNDKIANGQTALYIACNAGRPEIVRLLIGSPKVDVNLSTDDGNTPLFIASFNGTEGTFFFQ